MKKVEYAHIKSILDSLEYKFYVLEGTTTTACWAVKPDGFQCGYGESACVDPDAFNEELGKMYAKERAVADATNTLWKVEGYLLSVTGKTSDAF